MQWLLDNQEPDGSWYGRWGVNYIYGTGAAVPALIAAGIAVEAAPIRSAVAWLKRQQNDDGGWGEDPRSYDDRSLGRTGHIDRVADRVGVARTSGGRGARRHGGRSGESDGSRPPSGPTAAGTRRNSLVPGFPVDMYIKYEMYPLVFPMWALGRYLRARK